MANEFTLKLVIEDEGEMSFSSAEEVIAWCESEREHWKWMSGPPLQADRQARGVWRQFEQFYTEVYNAVEKFRSTSDVDELQRQLQGCIQAFVSTRRVALSGTIHGSKIHGVLVRLGGMTSDVARLRATLAHFHAANLDGDLPQSSTQYVRNAINALVDYDKEEGSHRSIEAALRKQMHRGSTELVKRQAELDACIAEHQKNMRAWREGIGEAIVECDLRTNAAVTALQEVQQLFQKQMGLQAPVQYWTDKAFEHRKLAEKYRNRLIIFGFVSIAICILAYIAVFKTVATGALQIENSVSASLLAFGGLALLTTAALWVARILSRLYLSQHHLAIDANERATMVTTYLALSKEGSVADQDRAIVLAALFRPTADGIVKDEAPPVMSPAALLSNLVIPGGR